MWDCLLLRYVDSHMRMECLDLDAEELSFKSWLMEFNMNSIVRKPKWIYTYKGDFV